MACWRTAFVSNWLIFSSCKHSFFSDFTCNVWVPEGQCSITGLQLLGLGGSAFAMDSVCEHNLHLLPCKKTGCFWQLAVPGCCGSLQNHGSIQIDDLWRYSKGSASSQITRFSGNRRFPRRFNRGPHDSPQLFWATLNTGLVLRYKTGGTSLGGTLTRVQSKPYLTECLSNIWHAASNFVWNGQWQVYVQEMCARAGLLQAVLDAFAFYRRSGDHVHTGGAAVWSCRVSSSMAGWEIPEATGVANV